MTPKTEAYPPRKDILGGQKTVGSSGSIEKRVMRTALTASHENFTKGMRLFFRHSFKPAGVEMWVESRVKC